MCELARELPADRDYTSFFGAVRKSARAFAVAVDELSGDEVRAEIKKLYEAATFKRPKTKRTTGVKYEKVAWACKRLKPQAAALLTARAARMSRAPEPRARVAVIGRTGEILTRNPQPFHVTLPTVDELRDPKRREHACETIRMLCSTGSDLYAPQVLYEERQSGGDPIRKRRPKRKAELEFVGALRLAWLQATGTAAARTASWHQPGPFVRLVGKCLQLVGAYPAPRPGEADRASIAAAKFIEEWERRRQAVRKQMLLKLIEKFRAKRTTALFFE